MAGMKLEAGVPKSYRERPGSLHLLPWNGASRRSSEPQNWGGAFAPLNGAKPILHLLHSRTFVRDCAMPDE